MTIGAPTRIPRFEAGESTSREPTAEYVGRADRCCPWCRRVEPNEWLLRNNHDSEFALREGHCIGQSLRRSHVVHDAAKLGHSIGLPHRIEAAPASDREHWRARLTVSIDRAIELWAHRSDTDWLDQARTVLASTGPPPAPDHHQVTAATREDALW